MSNEKWYSITVISGQNIFLLTHFHQTLHYILFI